MRDEEAWVRAPRHRTTARWFLAWLPALLICGGVLFELLSPMRLTASPFFSAAPLVVAPFFSLRATAATVVVSGLCVIGLRIDDGTMTQSESVIELVTVLTDGALALLINRVARRSDRKLASARGIAEAAQRAVLPTPAGSVGGLRVAARYEAALADARIGGDLYAVQPGPCGVRFIVGDVRGKGLDAVEAVAVVIGAFREAAEGESTLERVAARLEHALQREDGMREGLDRFEGFTTAVLAEVVPDRCRLRLLNRGHPPPLVLYADGGVLSAEPAEPALPLGMEELGPMPGMPDEFSFPPGATLLLYTDGVTEARNGAGVFYDPVERLRGRVFPGPDALLDAVVADVARHTGGLPADDMALLAIGRPSTRQADGSGTVGVAHGAQPAAGAGAPADRDGGGGSGDGVPGPMRPPDPTSDGCHRA